MDIGSSNSMKSSSSAFSTASTPYSGASAGSIGAVAVSEEAVSAVSEDFSPQAVRPIPSNRTEDKRAVLDDPLRQCGQPVV